MPGVTRLLPACRSYHVYGATKLSKSFTARVSSGLILGKSTPRPDRPQQLRLRPTQQRRGALGIAHPQPQQARLRPQACAARGGLLGSP